MQKLEELVQETLNIVRREKKLRGEFILIKSWEQGELKSQRCGVVTIYYRYNGKNIIIHRERICTVQDSDEQITMEALSQALANIIVNWDEIWNLINTKLQ